MLKTLLKCFLDWETFVRSTLKQVLNQTLISSFLVNNLMLYQIIIIIIVNEKKEEK